MIIDKAAVRQFDMGPMTQKLRIVYPNWDFRPGQCEYALYAVIANLFEDTTILEIGTGGGGSTFAFATNKTNKVITYDLQRRAEWLRQEPNVDVRIGDFMQDEIDYDKISLIMIDVDPHDAIQEPVMLDFLEKKGFRGLLLLDDIGPDWPAMNSWWNGLTHEKFDLTDVGHFSGTGLLNFGNRFELEVRQ